MSTKDNPLMGSDEAPTTDPEEFRKRREQRRKKLLEATEIPNPNSSDGNKQEQSVEDEYPVQEGKSQ